MLADGAAPLPEGVATLRVFDLDHVRAVVREEATGDLPEPSLGTGSGKRLRDCGGDSGGSKAGKGIAP